MNCLEIQKCNEQGVRAGQREDTGGSLADRPISAPADQESNDWQHLQSVQTQKMRRSQVSPLCAPIHDGKSWTSIPDAH